MPVKRLLAAAALALLAPAPAFADDRRQTTFKAHRAAEARLAITASAPGTGWGRAGRESAVATVTVDGRYSQDVVLFAGAQRFTYGVALGRGRSRPPPRPA